MAAAIPDRSQVLSAQGIPEDAVVPQPVEKLCTDAQQRFVELAAPTGVWAEISVEDFSQVYEGEGANAPETPVEEIYPEADCLSLFAVTVGEPVCHEIEELFAHNDPALGCMLDSVASLAADRLAKAVGEAFLRVLVATGRVSSNRRVLPYSPGYCGWHVSGQRPLFSYLRPKDVGITLRESCLMEPLKSVSGVLIVAEPEAHDFEIGFPFCCDCADQECRERIQSIMTDTRG